LGVRWVVMRGDSIGGSGGTADVLAPPKPRLRERRSTQDRGAPPPAPPDDGDGGGGDGWFDHSDEEGREPESDASPSGPSNGAATFALTLMMVGITTLFLVFIASWLLLRRHEPDPMRSSPLVPPGALWLSTVVLFASSMTIEMGTRRPRLTRRWLSISVALGVAFLASQSWLWWLLVDGGLVPSSGGYGAIFFALTGLHGVHAACGIGAMLVARRRLASATLQPESLRLCATYWHFMGVLWLVIFGVLYFLR
jgi:cytochrome c oxidase subunit 3